MHDYSSEITGIVASYMYLVFLFGLFYYIAPCAAIAHIAGQKGHSGWQWGLFAAFFSPLIVLFFLIAAPQRPSSWSVALEAEPAFGAIPTRAQRASWEQPSDANSAKL